MSLVGIFLLVLAGYYGIGLLVALRFVFVIAPRIDPVYQAAPLRVRLLFLPGAVSIWPITLRRASAIGVAQAESAQIGKTRTGDDA